MPSLLPSQSAPSHGQVACLPDVHQSITCCLPALCLLVCAAVQMGLHVFFGCYHNLFRLMNKCGVLQNLLTKDHTHR